MASEERDVDDFDKLVCYLEGCGGSDQHRFWLDDGKPDIDAARRFAEQIRRQLGEASIGVSQRYNTVKIALQRCGCTA